MNFPPFFRFRSEAEDDPELGRGNRKRKKRKFFDDENSDPQWGINGGHFKIPAFKNVETVVRKDVFSPEPEMESGILPEVIREQNSAFLKPVTDNLTSDILKGWSSRQVANFVLGLPKLSCDLANLANKIIHEEIDGVAFLLMTQNDFVTMLGIKLGPAIKIYNALLLIKKQKH